MLCKEKTTEVKLKVEFISLSDLEKAHREDQNSNKKFHQSHYGLPVPFLCKF
jgi:hypothetical protein